MIDVENGPVVMGVLNVTPDSFSDGRRYVDVDAAIEYGRFMISAGAKIIDVGGESTRPGAKPVDVSEEISRILPVVKGLAQGGAMISVDTRNAQTMREALLNGAGMVNDVSALMHDPKSIDIIREFKPIICLMHMQGYPSTMQARPAYGDVVRDVFDFLMSRIDACAAAGLDRSMILADPGIGFGKTLEHNLTLLKNLDKFHALGVSLMIGTSRKSFIEKIVPGAGTEDRLPGSLASVLWAYQKGVKIFRVHDVPETVQALKIWDSMAQSA
jgi:dihydropteroate synthase